MARPSVRQQAVAELKTRSLGSRLLCMDRSWRVERSLAVWHLLDFKARSEPARQRQLPELSDGQLLAVAWHDVDACQAMEQLRAVFEPSFPASRIIVMIQQLGLAYADGSLHPEAQAWLDASVSVLRRARGLDKSSTQPDPHSGPEAGGGLSLVKGRE